MIPLAYRATIHEDPPGEFLVTFPAVPEALTGGFSFAEALVNAHDCISVALEGYLEAGLAPPPPDAMEAAGEVSRPLIPVAPKVAARIFLQREMASRGITQAELGRLMGRDEKSVRRIVTGQGVTLGMTLKALAALGVFPALAV